MTTKNTDDVGTPMLGRDVKGKYVNAKASFVKSSGKIPGLGSLGYGGMTHPHLPITYYLIANNDFAKLK